jgi:hypothetical protein
MIDQRYGYFTEANSSKRHRAQQNSPRARANLGSPQLHEAVKSRAEGSGRRQVPAETGQICNEGGGIHLLSDILGVSMLAR